ncbi:Fe-S cluster assembly protein SufD, partial [candidate division KSB1 bacterium]
MESKMVQHTEPKAWYLSNFDFFESKLNGGTALPFHETRRDAISRFSELGFPTVRNEEWKYTNLAPMLEHKFKLLHQPVKITASTAARFEIPEVEQNLLVFVNGQFAPALSRLVSQAKGLVVESLAQALKRDPELAGKYLAQYAEYEKETFVALNTAFALDGAFIRVPRNL